MKLAHKNTKDGRLYFGDKDAAYLKKLSRTAVEDHHDSEILYFEIDYVNSQKNFYGELLMKNFKHPKGIPILGSYKIEEGSETMFQGIPSKLLKLNVSVYIDQLKEKGIDPQLGDYFSIGQRMYLIWNRSINDTGVGTLMFKRGRIRQDFFCYDDDFEVLNSNLFDPNIGSEQEIYPQNII